MASPCTGNNGGTGTQYTYAELQGLWINAGGPKAVAPIAAAIALAESGGCSADVNPKDNNGTQTSWGLWQWSDGTHNEPPGILDPFTNAQQAVMKYQTAGNSFSPWGTYTSGAYKAELGSGTPDLNVPSSASATAGNAAPSSGPPDCAWGKIPGVLGGVWPGACVITYKQARELLGAGVLVGGLLVIGFGTQLLIGVAALGVATKVIGPVASQVGGAQAAVKRARGVFSTSQKPAAKPKAGARPKPGGSSGSRKRPAAAAGARPARQYPVTSSPAPARRRPPAAAGARPARQET